MLTPIPLLTALLLQGALDPSHQSWSQFLALEGDFPTYQTRIAEGVGLTWFGPGTTSSNILAFVTDAPQATLVYTATPTAPERFTAARDVARIVVYEKSPLSLVAFGIDDPDPEWVWPIPGSVLANTNVPLDITADGARVVVKSDGRTVDRVHLLDGATGVEIGSHESSVINELFLADDGTRVAVASTVLSVLSLPGFATEISWPLASLALTPDVDRAARFEPAVGELEVWSRAPDGTWTRTPLPAGIQESPKALSRDGQILVTSAHSNGDLVIRDLAAGGIVVGTHDPPAGFWTAALDATGQRIAVEGQGWQLLEVLDRQGTVLADEDGLTNQSGFDFRAFDISEDGRFVAITGAIPTPLQNRRHVGMLDLDLSPLAYCVPKVSSSACLTLLDGGPTSNPVSGAGDFIVTANAVQPHRPGLFFYGTGGPADVPFVGGTLCVAPPLGRGSTQLSGGTISFACDGSFSLTLNDGQSGHDVGPGGKVWVQAWYRDRNNGPGNLGTALSDALEVTFD